MFAVWSQLMLPYGLNGVPPKIHVLKSQTPKPIWQSPPEWGHGEEMAVWAPTTGEALEQTSPARLDPGAGSGSVRNPFPSLVGCEPRPAG